MNTYIIHHNGKKYIGHNITLASYVTQVLAGQRVTDYIAFGKGTGTPMLSRLSLFEYLGDKPAQVIDINTDSEKGQYYIVRKITLDADEYVGEVITEFGFCAQSGGDLITHCVLPQGITKLNEPMEITAIFRLPKASGFLAGNNPLIKVFLGAQEFSPARLSCGYCKFQSIQDALDITQRYPCSVLRPNLVKIDCPIEDSNKTDLIMFYDDIPVIKADSRYAKGRAQLENYTVAQNGKVPLDSIAGIRINNAYINSNTITAALQAKPKGIASEFFSLKLQSQDQKLFVSKDRNFLLIIQDNHILVYQNALGNLVYIGEIILDSRVSCVDVCMGRLVVVCNHSDTPLRAASQRLYFYQLANNGITQKEFANDLDCDVDTISLEYASGTDMVLYYISNGILTGKTFSYLNPSLTFNCSFDVKQAKFLKTSYRRNIVFATDYEHNLDSSLHKALLDGELNSITGAILLNLKSIQPDQIRHTDELIITLNSNNKIAAAYSYLSRELKIIDLTKFMDNINSVFLDGQYFVLTDQDGNFKILQTDDLTAQAQALASGTLPCSNIDQVFIMCDLLLIKDQETLYYARIQSDEGWIYSDQFAYGDQASVRFADLIPANQTNFNICAVVCNITIG